MMMSLKKVPSVFLVSALAAIFCFFASSFASASKVYNVSVGANGQYSYDPQFIIGAQAGDAIRFQFKSGTSHSATESTYEQPCFSKSGGFDSGVRSTQNTNVTDFEITISANAQVWLHCVVGTHCSASGMVFALNPTPDRNFETFLARATGQLKADNAKAESSIQKYVVVLSILAHSLVHLFS